ncbi:MAG: CCA tRNA nucleotidyltransferase [Oscillospiraceae bacterium]|nr:CCA tRNA nucleotidyltransferase [Oscillospiraceae bacterium]
MMINIPLFVKKVIQTLERNGFEAYIVGGCVRDSLLGSVPNDWDICTSARPEEILSCFTGFRVIETGRRYGTIAVLVENHVVELTTFRVDGVSSDHRRPNTVAFSESLLEDLRRRDFTINAMAYHPKTGLIDLFGGQSDLSQKIIRSVGDPRERFEEDALRILRALRFASILGFAIEKNTADAIFAQRDLLKHIAKERITKEFSGILLGKDAVMALDAYSSVILGIFPELSPIIEPSEAGWAKISYWQHTLRSISLAPEDLVLRLALLFHGLAKQEENHHFCERDQNGAERTGQAMKRMKYDKATILAVSRLIAEQDTPLSPGEMEVKRHLKQAGEDTFRRILLFRRAQFMSLDRAEAEESLQSLQKIERTLQKVTEENQCWSLSQLRLDGQDVIALGVEEGPTVGKLLRQLLSMVIEGEIPNDKEVLLHNASRLSCPEQPTGEK